MAKGRGSTVRVEPVASDAAAPSVEMPHQSAMSELPWSPVLAGKAGSVPLVFTRDEEHFFVAASSAIRVYSTSSGRMLSTLSSSPFASTSYTDATPEAKRQAASAAHSAAITGLLLNPANAAQLVSSSLDGTIKVWDYLDGRLIRTLRMGLPIKRMTSHASLQGRVVVAVKKPRDEKRSASDKNASAEVQPSNTVIQLVQLTGAKYGVEVARPTTARIGKVRSLSDLAISSDGRFVVAVGKRKIHVAYIDGRQREGGMMKLLTDVNVTRIAFHPSNNTFATGHQNGQIRVWYFLSSGANGDADDADAVDEVQLPPSQGNKVQMAPTTLLHWHAHAVTALCFNDNGAVLMSGGEESVLVLWQLTTQSREYVPRLGGATIVSISAMNGVSATQQDQIVVALEDGSVTFISPINLKVVRTLAGVLANSSAHMASSAGKLAPAVRRRRARLPPLAVQPDSQHLVVTAGHTSTLQFLDTETDEQVMQQEIVPSNRVSRPDDDPLDQPQVEHVCFSAQRQWMATLDRMPSGQSSLKVWAWEAKTESYAVNTRIENPHGGVDVAVLGMAFSPRSYASIDSPLLVTYGTDNKCRAWRCVRQEIKRKQETFWIARSAFDHRNKTPRAIAWSVDGSLLAVVHGSSVALWEPEGNVLLHVMPLASGQASHDESNECLMAFVGSGGRYLAVAHDESLSVFDIVLGSLAYESRIASVVTGLIVLESEIGVLSSTSARSSTVSLFTTTSPEATATYTLPFGVRKVVSTTAGAQAQRLSFFALTHDYDVVRVGSLGEELADDQAKTTQALGSGHTVRRRRTLFDELLGPQDADAQAAVVVPDVSLSTATKRSDGDASKLFDMPSHLLPPPHLLLSPFLKMMLPTRREEVPTNTVEVPGEANKADEDGDVSMGVEAPAAANDTLQSRMARIAAYDLSGVTSSFAALTTDASAKLNGGAAKETALANGKVTEEATTMTNGTSTPSSLKKKKSAEKVADVSASPKKGGRPSRTASSPAKANGDVSASGGRKRKNSTSSIIDA